MPIRTMRPAGSVLATGLQEFVDTLPSGLLMAEIGSYAGETLPYFLQKAAQIFCIDRWEDYAETVGDTSHRMMIDQMTWVEDIFNRTGIIYGDRVVKVKDDSLTVAARCPPETFDLVYIDAGHTYADVRADIEAWWPKVRPGGRLAGHDYDRLRGGVQMAVQECCGQPDQLFPDSTWCFLLTPDLAARLRERGDHGGAESVGRNSVSDERRLPSV